MSNLYLTIILLALVIASLAGNFINLFYSRSIRREKNSEKREMYDALFETYEVLRRDIQHLRDQNEDKN